ncbi:Yos1-like protein [Xylaria grammica]|nr:Yos1-like protein [Xylaria grammica]
MMLIGNLIYVLVLLTNALAILSEDRFLARINFSSASYDPAFGTYPDTQSMRAKAINLLASVRTLMRSMWSPPLSLIHRSSETELWRRATPLMGKTPKPLVPLILTNTLIIIYELVLG